MDRHESSGQPQQPGAAARLELLKTIAGDHPLDALDTTIFDALTARREQIAQQYPNGLPSVSEADLQIQDPDARHTAINGFVLRTLGIADLATARADLPLDLQEQLRQEDAEAELEWEQGRQEYEAARRTLPPEASQQ